MKANGVFTGRLCGVEFFDAALRRAKAHPNFKTSPAGLIDEVHVRAREQYYASAKRTDHEAGEPNRGAGVSSTSEIAL
jgi:hypothetical protein